MKQYEMWYLNSPDESRQINLWDNGVQYFIDVWTTGETLITRTPTSQDVYETLIMSKVFKRVVY